MRIGWTDIHPRKLRCAFRFRTAILIASALSCVPLAAQQPAAPLDNAIRVDVNRVNVGVIVTDSKGNFVEGLQPANFQVFDNNQVQPISDFAPIDAPAQVLLLLEAGPAVYLLQDSHLFVAQALLSGLSPDDRVAFVVYNKAPTPVLDFTSDKRAVDSALNTIQFTLGYGDLNLASSLSTVLDWLTRVPGKKSVVLISTGVDTSPDQVQQSLVAGLQTADVRIFAVSMNAPFRNGKKGTRQQIHQTEQAFAQADAWLNALADASGGRAYFPENPSAFQQTYHQIAELVRHEYSLAFAPPQSDGAVHSIDVKVITTGAASHDAVSAYTVDHRRAYIAPKPPQ
ncbi:MAG TPA: VWA domain-containing protein [Candidatus Eremiobacteraceae bacterium]|nr:VWA domain-containing protein [Candidatus Eremiobacteraceae bacterium]